VSKEVVDDIMEYCRSNGRICPMPQEWNKLWKMLPDRVRDGAGWKPSMPLILGSWHESSPDMKI